jgi:hypothetical protein
LFDECQKLFLSILHKGVKAIGMQKRRVNQMGVQIALPFSNLAMYSDGATPPIILFVR